MEQKILMWLRKHPGATSREIAGGLGLGWGECWQRLRELEQAALCWSERVHFSSPLLWWASE